jgi:hypothetical protein
MPVAELTRELSYELLSGSDSFVFGEGTGFIVEDLEFTPGELRRTRTPEPRGDGDRHGRDTFGGNLLTFKLVVDQSPYPFDVPGPLLGQDQFSSAWRANSVRSQPGGVSVLRMRRGGRVRRAYGRPGRWKPDPERDRYGWVGITAEFECRDDLFYSDAERINSVSIVPPDAGGYMFPFTWPWGSVGVSYAPGVITVGGNEPAWMCFLIRGPITRPTIDVVGEWAATLDLSLAAGEWVSVDSRPWSRAVRNSGGAYISGSLTPGSPALSELRLKPGRHEVVLRGTDGTGTASMSTAWRDSWSSY